MKVTKDKTARERVLEVLRESPNGVSKSELYRRIGGNTGAFRRLIMSMEGREEILITEEDRPSCGLTRVVTIPDATRSA